MLVNSNIEDFDDEKYQKLPAKIWVCHCTQCKWSKNKRANRKYKQRVKRQLNKVRRRDSGIYYTHFWA